MPSLTKSQQIFARVILSGLAFGYLLPFIFRHYNTFVFRGGLMSAIGFGVIFTASMMFIGGAARRIAKLLDIPAEKLHSVLPTWALYALIWAISTAWLFGLSSLAAASPWGIYAVIYVQGWMTHIISGAVLTAIGAMTSLGTSNK